MTAETKQGIMYILLAVLIVFTLVISYKSGMNNKSSSHKGVSHHRCYIVNERTSELEKACCTVVENQWEKCEGNR